MNNLTALKDVTALLVTTGPWGIVVLLGWALLRKERDQNKLVEKFVELSEKQTSAMLRMETALKELKEGLFTSFLISGRTGPDKSARK